MIIDEDNIRVQYESTKESPILRDDVLPYPYKYTEKDQLYVLEGTTELTREQDFTVSYDGSVTILKDIPVGTVLTIYRSTPLDQGSEFPQEAPFSSKKIEDALDKLTMQNQEQREALSRALKLPMTASTDLTDLEMPTPEPNRSVKWNAEGTALVNTNFDPDTALEQTERFKKEAEQAAKDAVAAKESITTTEETLVNTAKQATDEINTLAEETQEAIENASKHKLNTKEIGSILESPVPQYNSDLHLADGSIIKSDDVNYEELYNKCLKKKRLDTDVDTTYYKYYSKNYSRIWYSTVESVPDRFFSLENVLNIPQGKMFLFDRAGNPIVKPSIAVQSYYKYELINAVGDTAPHQYLLFPIQSGDNQIKEPSAADRFDFYIYYDNHKVGANYTDITDITVLPPDVTSEYRRILLTREISGNVYYYYYKATPIEIHAYMTGSIADLTLLGEAGTHTLDTVPRPNLITEQQGSVTITVNDEFISTEDVATHEIRDQFYTVSDKDETYEIRYLHDELELVGDVRNELGVASQFSNVDYYKITKPIDTELTPEGVEVRTPITSLEMVFDFKMPSISDTREVCHVFLGTDSDNLSLTPGCFWVGFNPRHTWGSNSINGWGPAGHGVVSFPFVTSWDSFKLNTISPLDFDTRYTFKITYGEELVDGALKHMLKFFSAKHGEELVLQSQGEVSVEFMTAKFPTVFRLGNTYGWNGTSIFDGTLYLENCYIKINNKMWWGEKKVGYAVDKEGNPVQRYAGDNKFITKTKRGNVYETNPTGYTVIGPRPDVDGWWTNTAATQGWYLGTGLNNKHIYHASENYIDIKGKFYTGLYPDISGYRILFALVCTQLSHAPLRLLCPANSNMMNIALGGQATNAWIMADTPTNITVENNSEYSVHFYCDFTKKYKAVNDTWEEASDGTLHKYTLHIDKWNGPNEEPTRYEYTLYHTYRFGAAALDIYRISGCGTEVYSKVNNCSFINMHSISVNGRPLFNDNVHNLDRPSECVILPNIPETEDGMKSYAVCANGVTEELALANPKAEMDKYIDEQIKPLLQESADTAEATFNSYNKVMEKTYKDGVQALKNAGDAVRRSELARTYPVIQTYYNEATGDYYRIYARDNHGYYCEQGGCFPTPSTSYVDIWVNFFKKFRDQKYQAFCIQSHYDDVQYAGVWDKRLTGCMFGQVFNNGGFATWFAKGYLADSEVTE